MFGANISFAYQHIKEMPADFNPNKCFLDPPLFQNYSTEGNMKSKKLKFVDYSHTSTYTHNVQSFVPSGAVNAYEYMCSYKNSKGKIIHVWTSNIYKDINGNRIGTYVLYPDHPDPAGSLNKQKYIKTYTIPEYKGKTYSDWNDWYSQTFYDSDEVSDKYKDINQLEVYHVEKQPIYNEYKQFVIGYKYVPLYKYRYVGTFKIGTRKYHAWESYLNKSSEHRTWIYTKQPYPPKFEEREKWARKSHSLF